MVFFLGCQAEEFLAERSHLPTASGRQPCWENYLLTLISALTEQFCSFTFHFGAV
jgi:hypothetical protein